MFIFYSFVFLLKKNTRLICSQLHVDGDTLLQDGRCWFKSGVNSNLSLLALKELSHKIF